MTAGWVTATLFWVCALGSVATGFAVFRVSSMARATMALLVSFALAAGAVVLLQLGYLAVVVVLMMIMEMAVMAVFMLMYMMNPAGLMPMQMYHNKSVAMSASVGTFVVLAAGILAAPWPARAGSPPTDPTLELGLALMGSKMLVMVMIGIAMFATIVGSVVLATDRGRYDRLGDDLDAPRTDDPVPGGVGR
ncbi:NADH-quinone oxidoreductase subunit J [Rhodococcus antarcticus]|uniref:NADH-quinone oxidoreductase subunit J n=1 Tax=Rhodococcus antarcticus TaxID=2987751 RepID=A0ABY6P3M2_9NOCA|nr:NADH-quinone oxidoreductase subunit J [Rhodococcus antarcticus]UZJ26259.1 NADH-quinone oxidoreductase subunit J [Rhodococcus antarcticus]